MRFWQVYFSSADLCHESRIFSFITTSHIWVFINLKEGNAQKIGKDNISVTPGLYIFTSYVISNPKSSPVTTCHMHPYFRSNSVCKITRVQREAIIQSDDQENLPYRRIQPQYLYFSRFSRYIIETLPPLTGAFSEQKGGSGTAPTCKGYV